MLEGKKKKKVENNKKKVENNKQNVRNAIIC